MLLYEVEQIQTLYTWLDVSELVEKKVKSIWITQRADFFET